MKIGEIRELTTQVLILFDHLIPVTKAKEQLHQLDKTYGGMGLKIKSLDGGPNLIYNGEVIENPYRNKMLLTLSPKRFDEEVFSEEIFREYLKFFEGKIVPDPEEEENQLTGPVNCTTSRPKIQRIFSRSSRRTPRLP